MTDKANMFCGTAKVKEALELIHPAGEIFEIRTIKKIPGQKSVIRSAWFEDATTAANTLSKEYLEGTQCYMTLNPLKQETPKIYADHGSPSTFYNRYKNTADIDVDTRKWILIDIDPIRPTNTSSNEQELQDSYKVAGKIFQYLHTDHHFAEPLVVMSGNGYHLLFKVKMRANAENTAKVESLLHLLGEKFNSDISHVDTSVFNLARICKIPGTMAQKGESTEDRPHRMSKIFKKPKELQVTQMKAIDEVLRELKAEAKEENKEILSVEKVETEYTTQEANQDAFKKAQSLLEQIIDQYIKIKYKKYAKQITQAKRTYDVMIYDLEKCPWEADHSTHDRGQRFIVWDTGSIGFKCHHEHCKDRHFADIIEKYKIPWESKPSFFDPGANGKPKFNHRKMADYLMDRDHVIRVFGNLHIFRDGYYQQGRRFIENSMVQLYPMIRKNQRSEVMSMLDVLNPTNINSDPKDLYKIAFKNGILDISTMKMEPFNPKYIITNMIPWDYDPNFKDPQKELPLQKAIKDWADGNQETEKLLIEMAGYCLYRGTSLAKAFILTGNGSNGKSAYLTVLERLLGADNVSRLDISELSARFSTASLLGKLANLGDDISNTFMQGNSLRTFKILADNKVGLKAEKKGQDEFEFKSYAKLIFSANELPKMKTDGFLAIKRRLIIVPFTNRFHGKNLTFIEDITTKENMQWLIQAAVKALIQILTTGEFTENEETREALKAYSHQNSPILAWLDTLDRDYFRNGDFAETDKLFDSYKEFLKDRGTKEDFLPKKNTFSYQFREVTSWKSKRLTKGKKERGYIVDWDSLPI